MSEIDATGQAPQTSGHPSFAHYSERSAVVARLASPTGRLVSNSEVQTFLDCRRKWWLAWYRGMRARHEKPTGVRAIGDRIHRALAQWYVPDSAVRTEPQAALEALIVEDWHALDVYYAGIGEGIPTELAIDFNKDAGLERAMLEGYMEWILEEGQDSTLTILASEEYVEARFPIPNETAPVYLIGKFDVRAKRNSDDVRLFIDHKTVGSFIQKTAFLRMNPQMLQYHLMEYLTLENTAERCDGALYNMMRRVKRTATAKPPFYQRLEVRHNKHEIESYRLRLVGVIMTILAVEERLNEGHDHRTVAYARPNDDCSWKCDFALVCPLYDDGSRAEAMLEQYFVAGDPLSYYDKDKKEVK